MTALNYLGNNPVFGMIASIQGTAISFIMQKDVIPDGIEEVTAYLSVFGGLIIIVLTIVGKVRKELYYRKTRRKDD